MSKPRNKELLTQELISFKCCIQGLNPGSLNLEHLLLTRHSILPLYTVHTHTHTHAYTDILIYPVCITIYIHALTYRHMGTHMYIATFTCGQTYTFAYTETLTLTQA